MAPRRGAETQESQLVSLAFNEPLSWKPGKAIATATLLKRLKALAEELREADQEEIDSESLTKVAGELAHHNLLNHKDPGVRAYTAHCLVDILKLCAPDAPFTEIQNKDIFTLFIGKILPALSDPSNAYDLAHRYVLESLSEVKSILLVTEIENSDTLIMHLFNTFFDTMSGPSKATRGEEISKSAELHMRNILATLVDEAEVIPHGAVDMIVAQLLRAAAPGGGRKTEAKLDDKQSTLLLKEFPIAYEMAKYICNTCPAKMARYIAQYFNEVMIDFSESKGHKSNGNRRGSVDSEDDVPAGPTNTDLQELRKAHNLLRELWRASPSVLPNVIPQIEVELQAENVQLRLLATETLGDIVAGIGAAGPPALPVMDPAAYPQVTLNEREDQPIPDNVFTTPASPMSFSQTHPAVYSHFLGRGKDKSATIRSSWTTAIGRILVTSAGGIGLSRDEESILIKELTEKFTDHDEKVRISAVKAIAAFSLPELMGKLVPHGSISQPGSVLCALADRVRDPKRSVAYEALTTLGTIWGVASGEIAAGNESVILALGGIPSKILDVFWVNDKELNAALDHVLYERLMPLSYPPSKGKGLKATNGGSTTQVRGESSFDADKIRTERILLIVRSLDAKSKKAFFAIQARQRPWATALTGYIDCCEKFNGGVIEGDAQEVTSKLDNLIKYIAQFFADQTKSSVELRKYAKMHDRRSYHLLRCAMGKDKKADDFKTVWNAIKEFTKRIDNAPNAPPDLMETMLPVIYRSSCLVYNRSHLNAIMQYAKSDEGGFGTTAQEIVNEISEKNPELLKNNVSEICKTLEEQAPTATRSNGPGSVANLKACFVFAKSDSKTSLPKGRKFIQTLIDYAMYAMPPKAAKYATSILMEISERKEMHVKDLLEKTTNDWAYGEDHFLTKLATLSQLPVGDPELTEEFNDSILDITTQQILLNVRSPSKDVDPSWQSDVQLDEECQAKCWALKILINRLLTIDNNRSDVAKSVAEPVYKLLNGLIFKEGEISKHKDTPKHHKSRLRLVAAQLMLKLCRIKMFDDMLEPVEFNRLALVAQDAQAEVRRGFVEKLMKYLVKDKLSERFYTIVFMTAFEPNSTDFKSTIMTWIRSRAKHLKEKKLNTLERIFPRLLSLLAHHPDYSPEPDELSDHAKYILYYVSTVASAENIGLIYKFAQMVKQGRDGINPSESDNLYVLSELAQLVITKWQEKKGWTFQVYPGKVRVPLKLFTTLADHRMAQEVAMKAYLPDEMDGLIDTIVREEGSKKKKSTKRKTIDDLSHPATKKTKPDSRSIKGSGPKKERALKQVRVAKAKKTKRPSTPVESADRRRSGRGVSTSAKKVYEERDSDDDDEEMWDGVDQWDYFDEDGNPVESPPEAKEARVKARAKAKADTEAEEDPSDDLPDVPDDDEVEDVAEEAAEPSINSTPVPEAVSEAESEVEQVEEEIEEAVVLEPPRASRRVASAITANNRAAAPTKTTPNTKLKAPLSRPKAKTAGKSPAAGRAKAAPKLVGRAGVVAKGKKRLAKDVNNMDTSD